MSPCQRGGRRHYKVGDCYIFGGLWVGLGRRCRIIFWGGRFGSAFVMRDYWLSPLIRKQGWATVKLQGQVLEWSQQAWFSRLLSWRWIRRVEFDICWRSKSGKNRDTAKCTWGFNSNSEHLDMLSTRMPLAFSNIKFRFNLDTTNTTHGPFSGQSWLIFDWVHFQLFWQK